LSEPSSRPIGVRAPLTMTERDMSCLQGRAADAGDRGVGIAAPRGHGVDLKTRIGRRCAVVTDVTGVSGRSMVSHRVVRQ
jgi:hypothetical protein